MMNLNSSRQWLENSSNLVKVERELARRSLREFTRQGWHVVEPSIRPDVVTKAARRFAKKAGLAGVSLHTIRHSHGSQLLSLGVPLPTVSKRLGHANVHVTATVYAHALPEDEIAAAQIWDTAMSKALNSAPAHQSAKPKDRRVISIEQRKKPA